GDDCRPRAGRARQHARAARSAVWGSVPAGVDPGRRARRPRDDRDSAPEWPRRRAGAIRMERRRMSVRTLVVDDEAPARRRIRRLLAAEDGILVVGECGDGASAISMIGSMRPDLVFLDVQMPERDGFEVVKAIPRAKLPAILFVTAYDQYALRAFDVHAVDYLLKPFTADRFRTALTRARERIAGRAEDAGLATLATTLRNRPVYLSRLPVRTGGRT